MPRHSGMTVSKLRWLRTECRLKARLELVWRQASDDDSFATTRGAGNDLETRTWYVENVGQESKQGRIGCAVDWWRGHANLNGAVCQSFDRRPAGARSHHDRKHAALRVWRHPRRVISAGPHAATSAWPLTRVRRSRATSERSAAGTTGRPSAIATSSIVKSSSRVPVRWLTMRSEM